MLSQQQIINPSANLAVAPSDAKVVQPANVSPLIDQVIREAQKTFVTGYQNNEKLGVAIEIDAALRARVRSLDERLIQFKDDYFTWDANRIEGTNFIAAQGPQDTKDMGVFVANTVFNARLPINHVVALGNCQSYGYGHVFQNFYDYSIYEREEVFGDYKSVIQKISGEPSFSESGQCMPNGIVQSRLQITPANGDVKQKPKQLNVTVIGLVDNTSLYLAGGEKEIDQTSISSWPRFLQSCEERKEVLWQLYQISLREPILIHCTSGVGRTGHIILTLEILKNYDRLFVSNNPQIIAAGIHEILNRIRRNRPALVFVDEQFETAIRNAEILHQYALKKGYIQASTANTSTLGMFGVKQTKQTEQRVDVTTKLTVDHDGNIKFSFSV